MPTRSGRGRTSSSLANPTRSRTGTRASGKKDPPQGHYAAQCKARWTARQTCSVRTQTGIVNPCLHRPLREGRPRGYAFKRRRSTHVQRVPKDGGEARVAAIALRKQGVRDRPSDADVRVVPSDPELVGTVVSGVDQV